jgi:hypothetical protein
MAQYSLQEIMSARDAASAAGDTESVQVLSAEIDRLRGQITSSVQSPDTTAAGVVGAVTRGAAPVATGAALGALAGAPVGGIGAVPGAATGAAIGGLSTLVGDPVINAVNTAFGTNYSTPTEAMEYMLTRIGVPEARSEAEKIIQTAVAGGAGAGGMAGLGRSMQALGTTPQAQAVGQTLAAQPVQQIAGGAAGAATGELAGEAAQAMGAGPVVQTAAELVGSVAGGAAGARAAGLRARETAIQLPSDIADAQSRGIRVLTTDVVPPRTFMSKWVQTVGERIPFVGTSGQRLAQQEERISAVKDVLRDYGVTDISPNVLASQTDDIFKELAAKRAADLDRYVSAKKDVIERLDTMGTVPVDRTVAKIDEEIAKLTSLRSAQYKPAIDILEDWKASIQGQGLKNIEELRKGIGSAFSDPGLAGIKTTGEAALNRIYAPLRQDMADFIKANGERRDFDKWSVANKRLENMSGELESSALKNALDKGDLTPEVVDRMLFSQKPSEIRLLYRNLTPDGRALVRTRIMSKVAERSGGLDEISPQKYMSAVQKYGNSVGVFFKDDDLKNIEGLSRALQFTRRAQEAAVAPPTGVQAVPLIGADVLMQTFGNFMGATAAATTAGLAARLYESKPVRNAFAKVAQTVEGTPEEAAAIKRAMAALQQQATQQQEKE